MGGSSTTTNEIPQWLQDAGKENLARARAAGEIGYTPHYGPDVAALTAPQLATMQNTGQAANAFGMASPQGTGLPQAQTFAGGVQGYSSGGLFDQALNELKARNPGQFQAIQDFFINPQTGAAPGGFAPAQPAGQFNVYGTQAGSGGGGDTIDGNYDAYSGNYGGYSESWSNSDDAYGGDYGHTDGWFE